MTRFTRFFLCIGYYRAAGELQRLGYIDAAKNLRQQARDLDKQ